MRAVLVHQNPTQQFIDKLLAMHGYARGVAVGRATSGLAIVLRRLRGVSASMRVAIPTFICHDILAAVLEAKCEPIFCDASLADALPPLAEWERALAAGAKVIIMAHIFGNMADGANIKKLCDRYGAFLIDDAAQAFGCRRYGRLAGSAGDMGLFSFGPTKPIEVGGGVMLFRDEALAEDVAGDLAKRPAASEAERLAALAEFRARFYEAREALAVGAGPQKFAGLLKNYAPAVWRDWNETWAPQIIASMDEYGGAAEERKRKAAKWSKMLADCRVEPVEMGAECIPWRFAFRLPGVGWESQWRIGRGVRERGHNVSHWYIPAEWYMNAPGAHSVEAASLASEIFQVWVSPETSDDEIVAGAEEFRRQIDAVVRDNVRNV